MFRAVMKNTVRLLEIDRAAIYTFDGEAMRLMESTGIPPDKASQLGAEKTFTMLVPLVVPRRRTNDLVGVRTPGSRAQTDGYSCDPIKDLKRLGERAGTAIHFLQLNEQKSPAR